MENFFKWAKFLHFKVESAESKFLAT
jgi:hypothetical protein